MQRDLGASQDDWDEEQDPEGFKLAGSVPRAAAKNVDAAGTLMMRISSVRSPSRSDRDTYLNLCCLQERVFETDSYALHAGPSDANGPSAGPQSDDEDDLVIMDGPNANPGREDDDLVIIGGPDLSQAAAAKTLAQAEEKLGKRPADGNVDGPRKRQRAF